MNKRVTLVADGIDVTARSESQALAYLSEDARQFSSDWSYADAGVEDTEDDASEDADDARVEVDVDTPSGRGERIWTGRAEFSVVIEAGDEPSAYAAARALLAA
jgi:hypothetical protein